MSFSLCLSAGQFLSGLHTFKLPQSPCILPLGPPLFPLQVNMLSLFSRNNDIEISFSLLSDPSGFKFTPNPGTHLGMQFSSPKWMGVISLELQTGMGYIIKSFGLGVPAKKNDCEIYESQNRISLLLSHLSRL